MRNPTCCILFIACWVFAATSCYTPRYVYSPSAHNVPILINKGDSKLAFNISTTNNVIQEHPTSGCDIQGAYAFSKKFAAQLNYYHRTEKNGGDFSNAFLDSNVVNYTRNLTEIGFGYYRRLTGKNRAFFQVFAGIGIGRFRFSDIGRDVNNVFHNNYHNARVTKLYLQPAFTVKIKNFAASLSSRFSLIYYSDIKTDYSATELDNYQLDSLNYSPRLFWEPSTVYTFGFKKLPWLQLEFQGGVSFLQSKLFVDYRAFNFSAGILFDLPKLLKGKDSSK